MPNLTFEYDDHMPTCIVQGDGTDEDSREVSAEQAATIQRVLADYSAVCDFLWGITGDIVLEERK